MAGMAGSDAAATTTTAEDVFFLRVSALLARNCVSAATAYDVGCVIAVPASVDRRAVDRADMLLHACKAAAAPPIAGLDPSATPDKLMNRIISWGFSRELPGNTHAEECALLKLGLGAVEQDEQDGRASEPAALGAGAPAVAKGEAADLPATNVPSPSASGAHAPAAVESTTTAPSQGALHLPPVATVYTSMEPCSVRLSGRPPCTDRLLACRARRVVVAVPEPPKFVAACEGTVRLRAAGCEVLYGRDECAAEWAREVNAHHAPSGKPATGGAAEAEGEVEVAGTGKGASASGGEGAEGGKGNGKGE